MTNRPHFNVPDILAAAADLRSRGHVVETPADIGKPDLIQKLLASTDGSGRVEGHTHADWLAMDIKIVADKVDAVAVLPGWQRSRGARLETFVAFVYGKPILHYPNLQPVRRTSLVRAWLGDWADMMAKVRVT
jgi:hypothetical protein